MEITYCEAADTNDIITVLGIDEDTDMAGKLDNTHNFMKASRVLGRHMKRPVSIDSDYWIRQGITDGKDIFKTAAVFAQGVVEGSYSFNRKRLGEMKTEWTTDEIEGLVDEKDQLTVRVNGSYDITDALNTGIMTGHTVNRARALSMLPSNYFNVASFVQYVRSFSEKFDLKYRIYDDKKLADMGCGGIMAVGRGSTCDPPCLIEVRYEGCSERPEKIDAVLVGKGVFFDSGGYNLKSIESMDGMACDMCGAADVLAVLELLSKRHIKKNVVAVIPAVENLIGPAACKMNDVIRTMSGKTVEIYNTDAEGRLILCDAITYASRLEPGIIIDIATLTNSCSAALGPDVSGMFSNSADDARTMTETADVYGELIWQLPLFGVYHDMIYRSETADLINYAPGYGAGASIAASFLQEFVPDSTPWIHLDIVGTAVRKSADITGNKGPTGILIDAVTDFLTKM